MQHLQVTVELEPDAPLAQLEAVVKGLRVATDVAYQAETNRVRRLATEQMKFPTDDELLAALERWHSEGGEDHERSPIYRAVRQVDARKLMRGRLKIPRDVIYGLSQTGYDRVFSASLPVVGQIGLHVLDPILYDALVADQVARLMPGRVDIRGLHYGSPLWAWLIGKTTAEKTASTTVKVFEVARDYGPRRREAKADAVVAEATVGHRIADSALDIDIKAEKLREARLKNERLELENASRRMSLGAQQRRQWLIDEAIRLGRLDIADAIDALGDGDVQALGGLGNQPLQIEERHEPDDLCEQQGGA
ncbi:hypothetical protein [Mycobacterium marinum]|uniref:hypothetical protein n=1 Tax=Mycobacterium marinum TaxID=1781 RepID=UPI0021C340A2|nr:hypothetical protein [Mycobacterium marinum]